MTRERQIEENLIGWLTDGLKYTYRQDIRDRDSLERNFREKFCRMNRVNLSDAEFARLLDEIVSPDVFAVSKRLRETNTFFREDGTPLQYKLLETKNWCRNDYEVVNQLRINTRNSFQRYDVILLINGLPLVQIELKSLEVNPRRAIQQICDYKNDTGNGYGNSLLCFVQMFIVSNQTNTYYFANNNRQHFNFNAEEHYLPVYRWADPDNKKIVHLSAFAETFLQKCKLGEMIARYMVLVESERKLLIMRPYQIYAVKNIVQCIEDNCGNGYIWHTTGSGKTLTSFKAATLLKDNPEITKCLFVVDRKDLDRQTRDEFNKFQPGCVEENTNTNALVRRMLSEDYTDKIIVTTIQKLGIALDPKNRRDYHEQLSLLRNDRMVFIFDECHRSQFGENHKAIKEYFPNSQLFGFTGTPIFDENATYVQATGEEGHYKTTADVFQHLLHSYTITNAIEDNNVLRFHVDYYRNDDDEIQMNERTRKLGIVDSILDHHDAATNLRQFNALFATASINDAIEYYRLFQKRQVERKAADEHYEPLNIACVFSPPAEGNKDIMQIQEDLSQEREDVKTEPDKKKQALKDIINEYNRQFGTSHSVEEFDVYYQDVQQRIKDQKYSNKDYAHSNKIDITIVVDMLLTGFDSKFLNTLYVDKNLKYHNLIQAFSRTNRILNDTKPYGNILDFRAQQNDVDEAIRIFSGMPKEEARRVWLVEPASEIMQKYRKSIASLRDYMHSQGLECKAEDVFNLKGDAAKCGFINCFKEVQRYKTQLEQYIDISEHVGNCLAEPMAEYGLLPEDSLRAFRGAYLEMAKELKGRREKKNEDVDPQIEELDFELVLFASALIDYDYIMQLIARYVSEPTNIKMTKDELIGLIMSSANLLDERDDIRAYIDSLDGVNGREVEDIKRGYEDFKIGRHAEELQKVAQKHQLSLSALKAFADDIIARKIFDGEKLDDLLAPLDLGWRARTLKETELMNDLSPLLRRMAEGQEISGLSAYEE